jgi:hypothetical protein
MSWGLLLLAETISQKLRQGGILFMEVEGYWYRLVA